MRYLFLLIPAIATAIGLLCVVLVSPAWLGLVLPMGFLTLVGVRDLVQPRHSVLRNYPIIGHMRWFFEAVRPEFRQYFFASDKDERPFNRDQRALVYQRAKSVEDRAPFGTKFDAYEPDFSWVTHSVLAAPPTSDEYRIHVGGGDCRKPYRASILNVSGMSFGAISPNAIRALSRGAKMGGFAMNTGEGAISPYHRVEGADLIWQIASGYFGCRRTDGSFCADTFQDQAAADQVKMIEIKLSQGAKPGHGGVLPKEKISREIAETRHIPMGQDCISPARHSEFSTPVQLLDFVARLRDLSGGKPVGLKLCIGHAWEFMAIAKAMRHTGIAPDFITIDGAEGGTGAAPIEFTDNVGTPLAEGLSFAHNVLVGAGVRNQLCLAAAGKVVSAFDIIRLVSLGADYCNAARAFMFALGCIQSLSCHTNRCPVGLATTDPRRTRALVVPDKANRVYNFHRNTVHELAEVIGAAGLHHPAEIRRDMVFRRRGTSAVVSSEQRFRWLKPNELVEGTDDPIYACNWARAQVHSFLPARDEVDQPPMSMDKVR